MPPLTEPIRSKGPWFFAALVLIVGITGYTRMTAPWNLGVTNDEMRHVESWRNRYRTDDLYPIFLEKLEMGNYLSDENLERVRTVYEMGPLVQRGILVAIDGHPPLFPVIAEVIEAITKSNLAALRMPSALASMLAVFLMYRLGRLLVDETLGLWFAGLLAISFLAQIYAGIARPYAFAQLGTLTCLYVFVREQRYPNDSPWRFWLAALFAQSTHWLVWVLVGPLVLVELIRRWRGGAGIGKLFVQTWWYALISVSLLGLMAFHLSNPGIGGVRQVTPTLLVWWHFTLASPFTVLDHLLGMRPSNPLSPAGIGLLLLTGLGLGCVIGDPAYCRGRAGAALGLPAVRLGLVLVFVASVITAVFLFAASRFALVYVLAALILGGIGVHWVVRSRTISQIALLLVVIVFGGMRFIWPPDPYQYVFWKETDYGPVAAQLRESLEPGDIWCAYPYFYGDCLYPYGGLPEPVRPLSDQQWESFVLTLPRPDTHVMVFGRTDTIESYRHLRRAEERWDYFNEFSLVRIAPRPLPRR